MRVFEFHQKEQMVGDAHWPVRGFHARIDVEVDFATGEIPAKAQRRLVLETLRRVLEEADEEDIAVLSTPLHATAKTPEPETETNWDKPQGMDLRIIKSAHRIVTEVAKRGTSGREVLASELVGSIGLSAPTIGRLLREGEEANDYLSQYVRVSPAGRTKALDLTPEGRMLASKIRAGVVPA